MTLLLSKKGFEMLEERRIMPSSASTLHNSNGTSTSTVKECSTCEYFNKFQDKTDRSTTNGGLGNCIADPPQPAKSPKGTNSIAVFPMVTGNMRCGAWTPIEQENVA